MLYCCNAHVAFDVKHQKTPHARAFRRYHQQRAALVPRRLSFPLSLPLFFKYYN